MKQLAFFIDVDRCIYCQSCTIACSNENQTGNYRRRKVLSIPDHIHFGVINFSMSCNHCETPACMTVCKYNSIRKTGCGMSSKIAQPLQISNCLKSSVRLGGNVKRGIGLSFATIPPRQRHLPNWLFRKPAQNVTVQFSKSIRVAYMVPH